MSKNWITGREIMESCAGEIPMLLKPILPRTGLVSLVGSSDAGKSTLLRHLALSVAAGTDTFIGLPLTVAHKYAFYVSTEDTIDAVASSLHLQGQQFAEGTMERISFLFDHESIIDELSMKLMETPADLVVIDAWSDTFMGNPNNFVEVRSNLNKLKSVAREAKCCIMLLHHTIKNSEHHAPDKNRANGSGGFEQSVRCLLELRKVNGDERLLSILKGNMISSREKQQGFRLHFDEENRMFTRLEDNHSFDVSGQRRKFDKEKIVPILAEYRNQGLSIKESQLLLKEKFGAENTPGLTWLKENAKADIEKEKPVASENTKIVASDHEQFITEMNKAYKEEMNAEVKNEERLLGMKEMRSWYE